MNTLKKAGDFFVDRNLCFIVITIIVDSLITMFQQKIYVFLISKTISIIIIYKICLRCCAKESETKAKIVIRHRCMKVKTKTK